MGLWCKDMSRILLLSDCGVTDAPSKDEHLLAPLVREVYAFLDRNASLFTLSHSSLLYMHYVFSESIRALCLPLIYLFYYGLP